MAALRSEWTEARRIAAHYAPRLAREVMALAAAIVFVTTVTAAGLFVTGAA